MGVQLIGRNRIVRRIWFQTMPPCPSLRSVLMRAVPQRKISALRHDDDYPQQAPSVAQTLHEFAAPCCFAALSLCRSSNHVKRDCTQPDIFIEARLGVSRSAPKGGLVARGAAEGRAVSQSPQRPLNSALRFPNRPRRGRARAKPAQPQAEFYTARPNRDLAMSFGDFGRRATRENLLSQRTNINNEEPDPPLSHTD